MRVIDCPCGQRLEAESDDALTLALRTHLAQAHPDFDLSEEEVRESFTRLAHDAEPA